jgi:hypothetical protein
MKKGSRQALGDVLSVRRNWGRLGDHLSIRNLLASWLADILKFAGVHRTSRKRS